MKKCSSDTLRSLASDIELELVKLTRLEQDISDAKEKSRQNPQLSNLIYESIALKFHNFYTGCEHIFSLVSTDLNGGVPKGPDWHVRLLKRMSSVHEERKAVISSGTANLLNEFLGFRHVIRNIYSFDLDIERIDKLLSKYPDTWAQVEHDVSDFVTWLRDLAIALEA